MSIDMTKWEQIARENVHNRPAGQGRLAGKITIVTGAAQGFGKGIAEELYKEGATVVIADMNLALAQQVASEMGERAYAIGVNVSDEQSVADMVAETVEKFGGLDIMLANAGVVRSGPIATFEKKDMDFVTAVNYTGLFLTCKYAAIIMEAQHEAAPEPEPQPRRLPPPLRPAESPHRPQNHSLRPVFHHKYHCLSENIGKYT